MVSSAISGAEAIHAGENLLGLGRGGRNLDAEQHAVCIYATGDVPKQGINFSGTIRSVGEKIERYSIRLFKDETISYTFFKQFEQ